MEEENPAGHHVAKRARFNKSCVVVFDNADREEYISGFRKRKIKRRQAAELQKQAKERSKRLSERRERRKAREVTHGENNGSAEGSSINTDAVASEGGNDGRESQKDDVDKVYGTVTYEDENATTVVRTYAIHPAEDEDTQMTPKRLSLAATPRLNKSSAKKRKARIKKPKQVSEKRVKKLSRREKSVPKKLRPKKGKKRKH